MDQASRYEVQLYARYLFVSSVSDKISMVHQFFFIQPARLYPPYSADELYITRQTVDIDFSSFSDYKTPEKEIIGQKWLFH